VFILQSAVSRGLVALSVVLVLTSLVSYWYYLRMAWYMWFREPTDAVVDEAEPIAMNGSMKAALVISAVLIVLLGVLPNSLLDAAEKSAASLSVHAAGIGLNR
jgi:NADH-quinone oxidoreductase subunit N